jgi:hypothetical protein
MNENLNKTEQKTAEISFRNLLLKIEGWINYLISKWRTILIVSVLGAIVGYSISRFKKPVFVAASTFVLEDSDKMSGMGQFAGLASIVGIDLSLSDAGGIFQGDNILELYQSNSMIEKTLLSPISYNGQKQLLINRYIEVNKLREKWANSPFLKDLQFNADLESEPDSPEKRLKDSVLATIVKTVREEYLTIEKPDKRLNIIKAEVKAPDEIFAKGFNDQIVKNVNDFYIQTKTKKALLNVQLLQHKTDSIRLVMSGVKYSSADGANATAAPKGSDLSGSLSSIQPSQFSSQTNWAILSELVKNLELSKITLQKQMPLIQIIDRPKFPLERDSVSPLDGIVIGFLSFGFLTMFFLWLKKLYTELKNGLE